MTIQDLTQKLNKFPPDWKVYVFSDANAADLYPDVCDYDYLEANNINEDRQSKRVYITCLNQ